MIDIDGEGYGVGANDETNSMSLFDDFPTLLADWTTVRQSEQGEERFMYHMMHSQLPSRY